MNRWLLKTEPSAYSWDDLAREGRTAWTGVSNPQAQANLRAMRNGDVAVIYHSGERRAVGVAEIVREAYPEAGAGALVCVDVKVGVRLASPVSLDALRATRAFAGSALVRQGRLSVVPLDDPQWVALLSLAAAGPTRAMAPPRRKVRPARAPRPRGRSRGKARRR